MKKYTLVIIVFGALLLTMTACPSGENTQAGQNTGQNGTDSNITDQSGVSIDGAGATFPFPLYSSWAFQYGEITGAAINYQSVGSGAGISAIEQKTVDFGASDAPLKVEELDEYGLFQFPMIIGGVVPVINVSGINSGDLKLTAEAFAGIFLGEIQSWNDPAITESNPDLTLPDAPITVVHRADGSGTTWIFSNYLAAVSSDWADRVGVGKSLEWPVGIGGRGNEGVANYIGQVDSSIGYVEYAYAVQNNLTWCELENKAGKFVSPEISSFMAAAANADWANAPGYYLVLVNQPGDETWPITGASFILIYKEQADPSKAKSVLMFFDWCYSNGEMAEDMDYVPIPQNVVDLVKASWSEEITSGGSKVW